MNAASGTFGASWLRPALISAAVLLAAAAAAAPVSAQGGKPEHIRGTVTAVNGEAVTVKTREGAVVSIDLPEKARVSGLKKAELSQIGKGAYIGTAAVPQPDGVLVAQEVLIFPEQMRGVGEGHRPWDLTPDSTMTNAAVDAVVDSVKGREVVLVYKGGNKKLLVPEGTPIVTIVKAGRDMLKPGTHVFALATKSGEGKYTAIRLSLGIDGLVPPM